MIGNRWRLWLARRWFSARKTSGGRTSSLFASLGIAIGVAALVIVLAVMNGFQLGYINSILDISSYHIKVDQDNSTLPDEKLLVALGKEAGVQSVTPFWETQALVASRTGRMTPIRLRALPIDTGREDVAIARALGLDPDSFPEKEGITIGGALADFLNIEEGDTIDLSLISTSPEEGIIVAGAKLRVARIFRSGYYDFDFGLGFMSIDEAKAVFPSGTVRGYAYGIKLINRDRDAAIVSRLKAKGISDIEGWRDYNRSFFSALRTEKMVMMILIGLIFIVVGVNIFQAMRRSVFERMEEIALIKALGGSGNDLRRVFIIDGFVIGALGALVGLVLGLVIAININEIFGLVSTVLNAASSFLALLIGGKSTDFSIFSSSYFYLLEVPVRILFPETVFIVAAAIASAGSAAAAASGLISRLDPAELLRYE